MTVGQIVFLSIAILFGLVVVIGYFRRGESSELHYDDAARFARLLVIEIKLYEGYKLERGLKDNNLGQALGPEIEEARKKFRKRIPNPEYSVAFDEAVVEILAGGDRSKLGSYSR